jgi:hypothetical protein
MVFREIFLKIEPVPKLCLLNCNPRRGTTERNGVLSESDQGCGFQFCLSFQG